MPNLSVREASESYQQAMRNPLPGGSGVCDRCRTFTKPSFARCIHCRSGEPDHIAAVVPITYSEHLGQMHTVLRNYKERGSAQVRRYAQQRLTAILWRFLARHEVCVARAAGVGRFDLVTAVPSSDPERDEAGGELREVLRACLPIRARFERLLAATGNASWTRDFDPSRYRATRDLTGHTVLLVDDTWVTGGHAQSAACAAREAGALCVALVVIGRHVRPEWDVGEDVPETCRERMQKLPRRFNWEICAACAPGA